MLKLANTWQGGAYTLPTDAASLAALGTSMDEGARRQLQSMVTPDGRAVRLSLFVNVMNSTPFLHLQEAVQAQLKALPAEWHATATGIVPQLVDAQHALVQTQLESLGLSFLLVFVCIWVGLRSFRTMLLSIAPNVLPLVTGGITMYLLDIPLDAATVMAASVAMGIAVDDTVHLLATWRAKPAGGMSRSVHTAAVLEHIAPAMFIAAVVASIGFFALMQSAFLPIACFGLLSGITMLTAPWADFFLLPAILAWRAEP
jgi:predicted RND superfamily exporter protein